MSVSSPVVDNKATFDKLKHCKGSKQVETCSTFSKEPGMERKAVLLNLINEAYEIEQDFVSYLSDEQKLQLGSGDNWSAKDLVAHNAAWKRRHSENVTAVQQGKPATRVEDYAIENEKLFEEHKDWSWEEVLAYAKTVQQKLVNLVSELPGETLEIIGSFPWQTERPLWRAIYVYGYSHPLVHLAEHYRNRGDLGPAADLIKQLVEAMQSLDPGSAWQGGVHYNLACYHALSGALDEAIAELTQAIQLNPEFKDWAKEDRDLEALHAHPDFPDLVVLDGVEAFVN